MNLHYETVSPLLKETLQKLVNSPIFKDFTLVFITIEQPKLIRNIRV